MKSRAVKLVILISLLLSQVNATICSDLELDKEIVFGFFNGVQTTPKEARKALKLTETKFLDSYVSTKGEQIEYALFYNKTEGLADFAETFEQRANEHAKILKDKYDYFWYILNNSDDILDKIKKAIPATAELIKSQKDLEKTEAIEALIKLVSRSKTTDIIYSNHKNNINCIEEHNKKFVIFAHSQGNLFATQAYDYTVNTKKTPKNALALIHIAPASPTLRGKHFLENLDLVINGLRLTGSVPSVTHYMSNWKNRPPGINNDTDFLGHGLLEIYLNPYLDVSRDIYRETERVLDVLEFPKKIDNPPVDEGIDPNTFDYINECKNINFPSNVELYDKVIRKTIDLYRHLSKEEICNYIAENLPTTDTGGSTGEGGVDKGDNSETFDYKTQCSNIDFPDPIPDDLESSINEAISQVSGTIDTNILCNTISVLVQTYNATNGGGIPSL